MAAANACPASTGDERMDEMVRILSAWGYFIIGVSGGRKSQILPKLLISTHRG
jgi:hypothetical protein